MRELYRILKSLGVPVFALALAACNGAETGPTPVLWEISTTPAAQPYAGADAGVMDRYAHLPRPKVKPPVPSWWRSGKARPETESKRPIETSTEFLIGLSEQEIRTLLGPANVTVISTLSQILEYRFDGCRVRLHLYADIKTEIYRVLHLEKLAVGREPEPRTRCFAMIDDFSSYEGLL